MTAFRIVDAEDVGVMEILKDMEKFQSVGQNILNRSRIIQVTFHVKTDLLILFSMLRFEKFPSNPSDMNNKELSKKGKIIKFNARNEIEIVFSIIIFETLFKKIYCYTFYVIKTSASVSIPQETLSNNYYLKYKWNVNVFVSN